MSRKKQAPKRIFYPDPKYGSTVLAKFINFVMYDGKKTTSEKIIYKALDKIKEKTKDDPIKVFNEAIGNIRPSTLKLGVAAAQDLGAAAMLVALADMPRVSTMHFLHPLDAGERADSVIASSDGARTMPPALFAAGRFSELAASHGDRGGRELIRNGRHITAPSGELIDIDTTEELEQLRSLE